MASRPHMPGYGIAGPTEGAGLLPWSWAVRRLTTSHDYWVATINAKYGTDYGIAFFLANATFQLHPTWAFGLL